MSTIPLSLAISFSLLFPLSVPPPTVTVTPSSVEAYYNETITLFCKVSSLVPVSISWSTIANINIDQSEVVSSTDELWNSTLTLFQITLDHIGDYTCTASQSVGGGKNNDSASINVLGMFFYMYMYCLVTSYVTVYEKTYTLAQK